jgi:TfoX/Sxy family transcriptional regulator of competence genes
VAYDEALANRVRVAVADRAQFDEKKMFGGLAFMVNTHMACGLVGDDLMVRVGAANHDDALARGADEMDFTGRPMRGMVMVRAENLGSDDVLDEWVDRGVAFAQAEPPKPPKVRTPSAT